VIGFPSLDRILSNAFHVFFEYLPYVGILQIQYLSAMIQRDIPDLQKADFITSGRLDDTGDILCVNTIQHESSDFGFRNETNEISSGHRPIRTMQFNIFQDQMVEIEKEINPHRGALRRVVHYDKSIHNQRPYGWPSIVFEVIKSCVKCRSEIEA
jgi:hypothetical protein